MSANVASTVQSPAMGAVVYVLPDSEPPHEPPTDAEYPGKAATLKVVVPPSGIDCGESGVIEPLGPAVGVTVWRTRAKVATIVQSLLASAVV
jgi:hypothetical protein